MTTNSLHGVLATDRRPVRTGTFAAILTLAWRAMLKIKHVPFQLFDVLVFPIMMTLMFTYLFGGALAGSTEIYLQWLVPGIVVQTMVFLTVYTGVSLNTDIQKGLFDRFRSLPMWQPSPILGALAGDLFGGGGGHACLEGGVVVIVAQQLKLLGDDGGAPVIEPAVP